MAEYNEENTRGGKTGVAIRKAVNSDTYKGLSSAMLGSAYRSFGKAFDGGGYTPRGMRPDTSYLDQWEEAGKSAQQRLEERWHVSEFENFQKNHLNDYQNYLQGLLEKRQGILNRLAEGEWEHDDGRVQEFDFNNPADIAKMSRLKGQVERQATQALTEAQVNLNITARSKYGKNPIVNNMIQQMMEGQTRMLASQFQTPMTNEQAEFDQSMRAGEADIGYKKALTRQADANAAATSREAQGAYNSTDEVYRSLGPVGAVRYFLNDVRGQQMLEGTAAADHFLKLRTQAGEDEIARRGWGPEEMQSPVNQKVISDFLDRQAPRLQLRSIYEWMKDEYGQEAADAVAAERPGMLPDKAKPVKPAVTVMPSKKDMKDKKRKWQALGVEAANKKLRENPEMTKEEVEKWLTDDWFPEAIEGRDVDSGNQLLHAIQAGLTADPSLKRVQPYLKQVFESLEEAFQWIGTGEGTDQLFDHQRPPQPTTRGARRAQGTAKATGLFIDAITPDALFPGLAVPRRPNFREEFPQEE